MVYYRNIENDQVLTLEELKTDFDNFKKEDPTNYDMSFSAYLQDCLSKNGSLEKLLSADDIRNARKNVDLYVYTDNGIFDGAYSVYFDCVFFCIPSNRIIYGYSIAHK